MTEEFLKKANELSNEIKALTNLLNVLKQKDVVGIYVGSESKGQIKSVWLPEWVQQNLHTHMMLVISLMEERLKDAKEEFKNL